DHPTPAGWMQALAAGGDVLGRACLGESGLGRREARDRHAERRAGDVVELEAVAEADRARLTTVFATDADLQLGLDAAAALGRDTHQVADAFLVETLERIALEDTVLEVTRQELPLGIVAGEAERRLRQVVRAEGEEVGLGCDLVGAHTCARQLDHRSDRTRDIGRFFGPYALGQLAQPAQLL